LRECPIADLLDKRLAFVTGKGGVGKTTVAYALGLAAAAAGKRAIVCEIAAQERGSRIFGRSPIGFHETRVSQGLWAISIDPERTIREYLEVQMPMRSMAAILARSNLFGYLTAATPGLQEMVSMGKVWELTLNERKSPDAERTYDIVIVDAPATGHGIAFLQTPHEFRDLARVGPLAHQAGRIERTLADPTATGVAIVARGEEMAVNEAIALERSLAGPDAGTRFEIDRFYVNCLYPDRLSGPERKLIERVVKRSANESARAAEPALRAALEEATRAAAQREQLERLREQVAGPVAELPFLFAPGLGPEQLSRLAGVLT